MEIHMKRHATVLSALALAALVALPAAMEAQTTSAFSVTARGGGAFPSSDFGDVVDSGWGFSGDVEFAFHPRLAAYGGYSWFEFDPEDESGEDVTSKGWDAGLKLILLPREGLMPWARAGVVYMEAESGGFESGSELGYEAAIGVDWPLGNVLTFVPMVRYQQYEIEDGTDHLDINYLTVEAGLKLNFGSVGL